MKYNQLGATNLNVSEICLGTMTWGSQNTQDQAHQQIDMALDYGVNFIDTAELYPTTPISSKTQGLTETYTGAWLKKSGKRDAVILATKVVGVGVSHIRGGGFITADGIEQALDASLQRLQTDYIDLYQLHWPNRGSYHFRQNWRFSPEKQDEKTQQDMLLQLQALEKHIQSGKIRHIGLSNESAWGTMKFLQLAKEHGLSNLVSVQNEYNLLCRLYDLDMAEMSQHENVGLLAYSPLAAGFLTGKYYQGAIPADSRASINKNLHGRISQYSQIAADKYVDLAKTHGLDPSQMALAFCLAQPFMTSVIIGATDLQQLATDIESTELELTETIQKQIYNIYREHPMPM